MFFSEYSLWLNTFLSSFKHVFFFIMRHLYFCKSFLRLSYKNTQLLFLWRRFLIYFRRKALTDDFGGLRKNMNSAFPLTKKNVWGKIMEIPRHFRVVLTQCLRNPRTRQFPTFPVFPLVSLPVSYFRSYDGHICFGKGANFAYFSHNDVQTAMARKGKAYFLKA